jgi:peroxiredoxin Q/BCP
MADGTMINVGDPAPDFTLPAHDGSEVRLSDYRGKTPVVLFYYPRANTPGCTRETAEFAKRYDEFKRAGAEVFGVSGDSLKANCNFADKLDVGFKLLTDKDLELWRSFGVRKAGSKELKRITFVIDKDGIVRLAFAFGRGDVLDHVRESLKVVEELNS